MGNRFGVQGLGAKPIHSLRDLDNVRTSEENRPTEDPVTAQRIPVYLEERYDGVQRRHPETTIPKRSTLEEIVRFGDGAEKDYFDKVPPSEVRTSHTMPLLNEKLKINATMLASSYEYLEKNELGTASNPGAVGLRRRR